jgi:RimJ/RimL family protein N-acetyltransferase
VTATAPRVVATGTLVRIREKRLEDAALDHEWRKDPELAAYDAAQPLTMSLRAYVATVADEIETPVTHRRSYSIDALDEDRHIGNLMYYGYDPGLAEAELGITIGDRAYWSRGYGSDAVKGMLGFLFGELELRRVYLHTLTWNDRAQQAFANAGFSPVREVRRGGYDFVLMEVLREQYEQQRAGD